MTLWFAIQCPATPWYAKALGMFIVGYALSPIDLISDFILGLGYVDDVLLLPALIWLAVRLIPESPLVECRIRADDWMRRKAKPSSRMGAVVIVILWIAISGAGWYWWAHHG